MNSEEIDLPAVIVLLLWLTLPLVTWASLSSFFFTQPKNPELLLVWFPRYPVPGIKLRTFQLPGRCSAPELYPQPPSRILITDSVLILKTVKYNRVRQGIMM